MESPPSAAAKGSEGARGPPPQPVEGSWARRVRRLLATQLQDTGRAEPRQVEALVAELVAVFAGVLQKSSRGAWLRLMEALRLLGPFQHLLAGRPELLPYLDSLRYQYRSSQALVSDLDVLGAVGRAFPQDWPLLGGPLQAARPKDPAPLAKALPCGPEPVFAGLPFPFAPDGGLEDTSGLLHPAPITLQELQRSAGAVGSVLSLEEAPHASCLGLMALSIATDVPTEYLPCPAPEEEPVVVAAQLPLEPCPAAPRAQREKVAPAAGEGPPMTGLQAVEVFVRNRQARQMRFLYLNVASSRHFRPYDLVVVPKRLAAPHHYVFSPFGVLHVHPEEGTEALALGAWHRQAMLWQLLQHIPFFRLFLVRKAFLRWACHVKHLCRLKHRQMLGSELLHAVPHFGAALLHISRLLQEMRTAHWLPQSAAKCWSFTELEWALSQENSHAQDLLHRFLTLSSSILELVRDDTYKMVDRLQAQVQGQKLYVTKESLYNQRMESERLQRRLQDAESWLQKLGFLALLVNFFICQNLVSIVQEELTAFVSRTMQADGTKRKAIIQVELVFDAEEKLAIFPSSTELEACLLGALDSVVESVLLVTQSKSEAAGVPPEPEQSPSQPSRGPGSRGPSLSRGPAVQEKSLGSRAGQGLSEPLCRLPVGPSGEDPQLVHRLNLKAMGGLEVVGHRLRGQYPLLSREQLEKDLRSDRVVQEARAKQQALLRTALLESHHLCREYSWLSELYHFAHSWSADQLGDMKGWPYEEYVNRIVKLRTWMSRVKQVPQSVVTSNCLLFVDCSGIHRDILPLLAAITEDILSLLLQETTQRSELLIAEISEVLQLYLSISTDIFTIAKCSQKLEHYQGQMAELQKSVDYVRGLNEVIQQCFRPLSSSEESLENTLLDTWDAFVYQQREVSDFIVSRRLSIIAELSRSLHKAVRELQEILAVVTVGRFQDPSQNPRAMEEELHKLLQRFQVMVVRIAELCRSQKILTGESMDVSFVTGGQGAVEHHLCIWRLFRVITEQITEWKCLTFFKFNANLAVEKTDEWFAEIFHLEGSFPTGHPILQACLRALRNFQKYLPLLQKLSSHFIKVGCWKEIFAAMDAKCPINMQFTLGQLLAHPLLEHSDSILRIYTCEKCRYHSRDTLNRMQKFWSEKQFRLVNFILNVPYQAQAERSRRLGGSHQRPAKREYISKDSGTYVLSDTVELKASVEHSLLTLQNMILSPYSAELQEEAVRWSSMLRSFESLLEAWVSFQQKWVFLNIVLYEKDISLPSAQLESQFQVVDAFFRELMQVTCQDPLVLSSIKPVLGSCRESHFAGSPLQAALTEASGELQGIIRALDYVLEATRMAFPRLFFLSNEELVAMVATTAESADASSWARRCFPGVRQLHLVVPSAVQSASTFCALPVELHVTGLVGEQGEKLKLCAMVPLSRKATQWLCTLERAMKETLFYRLQDCLAQRLALRPQLDLAFQKPPGPTELPLHLLVEHWATLGTTFPIQCVLLAEEALWRVDLEEALGGPGSQAGLALKLTLKAEALTHYLRNFRSLHTWQPESDSLGVLLGGLLGLTIQQRDVLSQLQGHKVSSPQAFEWARHFKYRVALKAEKAKAARVPLSKWAGSPPGCWAEILDCRCPYDYEYLGPGTRPLGSPSLDRAFLGLFLALDDFCCGGLLGHHGSGKSHAAQGLALALGRQLVTLHCSKQMPISCLSRYLCGCVHAGALLLLESVERLEPAVLSAFGQRLADLRKLCWRVREARGGGAGPSPTSQDSADSSSESEEKQVAAAPELGPDEAEPYRPQVIGNILFGGRLLRVRETYGCLATLERLPEALRLVMRPLVILPPDLTRLAEVTLLVAGFREATRLAEKLSAFLCLEGELGPAPPASRAALVREVVSKAISILFNPNPQWDPLLSRPRASSRATFFLGLEEAPAVIKALCTSRLLSGPEGPRLHHVLNLLRGIFPAVTLRPPEPPTFPRLQSALVAQLHEERLHPDSQLLSTAGQLFQALWSAPSVLLLGCSGSGKTTAWRVLAKAVSRLAASEAAALVHSASGHGPGLAASFLSVNAVCIWPNALSVAEFLGSLEEGIWRDGVLSRLLQRADTSALVGGAGAGSSQQWVVLDGAASATWLEPISSLFGPKPALHLPSGQKLQLPESVKVLFEMSTAAGMPPSICAHSVLLHCSGSGLWQGVLAGLLGSSLHRTYSLTQQSQAMLRELAEDLFPRTVAFLQQQRCSSVLAPHASPRPLVEPGLQETTAFTRILRAQLEQHLRREKFWSVPTQQPQDSRLSSFETSTPLSARLEEAIPAHHHALARSFFVFAYIWGFGGHLHPRSWPLFERFARRAICSSRHPVQLPPAVSAFDLCPRPEDGTLQPFDGRYLYCRVKSIPSTFCVLPQYERALYLLDLLLGSSQPVLLVGEPGCGKTSFAETLLQPNHLYQRVCVSFMLKASHLRQLLQKKLREKGPLPFGKPVRARAQKGHFLFLVEDLHMAPLDPARGMSLVVESLRQALTHQQFYHADTLELQRFPAGGFNCFVTLSVPVPGVMPLCPRFGRLFSMVVLPSLTRETLLSMHMPATLAWVEKFPLLTRHSDLATTLVRATVDAYEAVSKQFLPSPACCLFHFSLHSLRQVFRGLFLLRPRPGIHLSCPLEEQGVKSMFSRRSVGGSRIPTGTSHAGVLSIRLIVRLWLHEALRTFGDPLRGRSQRAACGQLLMEIAMANFCARRPFPHPVPSLGPQSPQPPSRSHLSFYQSSLSRSSAWASALLEEEGEEEEEEEDLLPDPENLQEFPVSVEAEHPDLWDPVLHAPALALEPPDSKEDPALGGLQAEPAGAAVEEQGAKKGEAALVVPSPTPRHSQAPHPLSSRRASLPKAKRRLSSKKESAGPLLPAHLLLLRGELLGDIVFSQELGPEQHSPGVHNPYQERVWRALESQLAPLLPPDFLMPAEVLKHVVHLCRLLCGPERHGALVSFRRCTGRQSLVALAARATDSLLMELPAESDEAQVLALLRLASWEAGVQGRRVLLLVHAGLSIGLLYLVLALMAEGTCPGLYGPEDIIPVVQALAEQQVAKRSMREDILLQRFFQLVRDNLHVFLLLGGPSGQGPSSLGLSPFATTALSHLLCSLKIYQAWSITSLQEVASKQLQGKLKQASALSPGRSSLQTSQNLVPYAAKAAALIHSMASTYAKYLAAHLPLVTPRSFLDFLDTFVWLLGHLQEQNCQRVEKMKLALHKMEEVSEKQQTHSRNVRVLQEKLEKIKQQVIDSQREVEREQMVLRQQEKECQVYEARIDALTKEREELEKAKELAIKKMSSDYKVALAGLRPHDIEELRGYRQPPEQVVWVLDTLCMMFGKKPGWENAKLLLCQKDFYEELVFYPKDTISTELFGELGRVVGGNNFRLASIRSASRAAVALWGWICAIYWYHQALLSWQPSLARLEHCDVQINSEKAQLGHSRLISENLRDATQARIRELKETQRQQQQLLQQLTQTLQAREEASCVESSVAKHMASWTVQTQVLEQQHSTLHGDALVCAAALAYLGPFPSARREELLAKWQALCAGGRVSLGPDDVGRLLQRELPCPGSASAGPPLLPVQQPFRLASLLSSAREQRLWDRAQVPGDPDSRLAALLLHSETHRLAHRWPLLVDPNKQAAAWLLLEAAVHEVESQALLSTELEPEMVEQRDCEETPKDNLVVLSLKDPNLEQNLLTSASTGVPVLLVDMEKNIPWCPVLQQLVKKEPLQGVPSTCSQTPQERSVSSSFQLYLCAHIPLEALATELDPSVLKILNVIDLSLSPAELEELLLAEVLHSERHEILKHRRALQLGVLQLEAKLEATDEELVALISKPQRSLLEEENFMPMVQLLQTQLQALHATHQHMVSLYQDQAALCDQYRPVARLGLALHQALQQLGRLHPLYLFPAQDCFSRMRQALFSTKRSDIDKQESLEAHLLELSKAVLRHLLVQSLPGLRETDRLLYPFLGALAMLQVAGDSSPLERLAFFQGFREPAAQELLRPEAGVPRPSWVGEGAWQECRLLERLPGFQGLLASLAGRPAQWLEYFRLPSTVVGLALCPSHAHLSLFQRAVLWRVLRPEAMSRVICDLTTCLLGWSPTEEEAITSAYSHSRANRPVVFVVPPAGAPGSFTPPLHWIEQMAQQQGRGKIAVTSLGTSDAVGRVLRMLPYCAKKGKWLVLSGCHLQERWDPKVLAQLDRILGTQAGDTEGGDFEIHPKFRLWFITAADAPGSVPGPVHRNSVVLFCEMPLELRSILARTHHLLQGKVPGLDTNQRLALLVLYAAVNYRQAYGHWTQADSYLWSQVELWEGLKAQDRLSRLMDNSGAALQELAGSIPFGGHILDSGDAEATQYLTQQCLSSDAVESGLSSLLAAVRGNPDPELSEEEAAAATQARIKRLPMPMEPAWVGQCSGLQQELLSSRSRAMLSALQKAQGLWQPRRLPSGQPKAAVEELVAQGLQLTQELQGKLEACGWEVGVRIPVPKGQPHSSLRPLQRFLLEEAGGLLALLQQVQRDLQCCQEHLQGPPCPSPHCTAILRELKQGRVPCLWLRYTPTGPQPPQAWLQTLRRRCQLLCRYLKDQAGVTFQLAAFHYPQRLFLALRQEAARAEKQELDRYSLEQQVLLTMRPPSNAPNKGGLYLTGLELRHALWDTHSYRLQEAPSAQPCKLPAIWVQAAFKPWKVPSQKPTYQCPVFLGTPDAFVPLGRRKPVTHVALPCQLAPEVCAQRRVHAVSILQEDRSSP